MPTRNKQRPVAKAKRLSIRVASLFGTAGKLATGDKEVRKATARSIKSLRGDGLSRGTSVKRVGESKIRNAIIAGNRKAAGLPPL